MNGLKRIKWIKLVSAWLCKNDLTNRIDFDVVENYGWQSNFSPVFDLCLFLSFWIFKPIIIQSFSKLKHSHTHTHSFDYQTKILRAAITLNIRNTDKYLNWAFERKKNLPIMTALFWVNVFIVCVCNSILRRIECWSLKIESNNIIPIK